MSDGGASLITGFICFVIAERFNARGLKRPQWIATGIGGFFVLVGLIIIG